jgi:hypothetical protein
MVMKQTTRKWPLVAGATAIFCCVLGLSRVNAQNEAITKQQYMAYIQATAEEGWNNLDETRERWKKNLNLENVFGYVPPSNDIYLATLAANLYEITGDSKYLERVKTLLLYYGEYKKAYPADFYKTKDEYANGLPTLPNFFTFGKYVQAYEILRKHYTLAKGEKEIIEGNISESADFGLNFQEWGPMNRAMLRAEGLLYAAKTLPDHPHRNKWLMLGQAILNDNWGQWEIEDASGYNAIWLYSLLRYANYVREDESLFTTPIMNYYFQYYLALISPAGIVPDFGDANWGSSWNRMIPIFEKGAAAYRDPKLRWAAAQYFRKYLDPMPERKSLFAALTLADAYRWANFDLHAERPGTGSQEVLEDIVGKKVVFRNGWDKNSTYLLYNYRDEGDGGWLFREYLRTTIPVEEEKMHHGHSDENSIILLMKNNTVLLHDGGYRDFMPSGPFGAYRADYYHNRVVVRDGKITMGQRQGQHRYAVRDAVPGQSALDFFRNSGAYRQVRTQKIDFLTLERYDMARTRLIDDNLGYEADRVINYIKDLGWFVVFDVVRFTKQNYLTMANLWHSRQILAQGPGWYDTTYDSLRNRYVGGDERLLIYFPHRERLTEGVESQRRYYQDEKVIYQLTGKHGYLNDLQAFVTVLIPHSGDEDPEELIKQVKVLDIEKFPEAVGVTISLGDKKYLLGAKLDMQAELIRDWRRPMYTYDSGKVQYGDYETDAYHLFVVEDRKSIHYAISGAVKITYKDRVLHEQLPVEFGLNFDGSPDLPGVGKFRYWEERAEK